MNFNADIFPPVALFCSDLDDTLLDANGPDGRFGRLWADLPADRRPLLAYSTGRTVRDTLRLIMTGALPAADAIIGSVGTELWVPGDPGATARFAHALEAGWKRRAVERVVKALPGVVRQPPEFQSPLKSSWLLGSARRTQPGRLRRELKAAGLDALVVWSGGRFLDVLPPLAGKANALRWLCHRLRIPLAQVLVAGDSGNDADMLTLRGTRAILIGNAEPELGRIRRAAVYHARAPSVGGVIEGLIRFGVSAKNGTPALPAA
jgi:sucrose-6F-phosphate phosphohydrolase